MVVDHPSLARAGSCALELASKPRAPLLPRLAPGGGLGLIQLY